MKPTTTKLSHDSEVSAVMTDLAEVYMPSMVWLTTEEDDLSIIYSLEGGVL